MPIPSTRPRISNSSPSRITAVLPPVIGTVLAPYAPRTARSVRPQHLEQLVDHRIVAEVAAAGDRAQRRGVDPAVADRGLGDVHADHLADHQILVSWCPIDALERHGVPGPHSSAHGEAAT